MRDKGREEEKEERENRRNFGPFITIPDLPPFSIFIPWAGLLHEFELAFGLWEKCLIDPKVSPGRAISRREKRKREFSYRRYFFYI